MKSAFQLSNHLDPDAAQYELKSLMEACAEMTNLLESVDDRDQQRLIPFTVALARLIPFAAALARRMRQVCALYDEPRIKEDKGNGGIIFQSL